MTSGLPPTSVVPFKKPNHIVGRDEIVKALHERLRKGNVALTPALTGQGGIGKTQLAALYIHTYPQAFPGGVFWLNCADPNRILGQIAEAFAPKLGIKSPLQGPAARRRELAAGWLAAVRNEPDILIVADNLEEPRLLESLAGLEHSQLTALGCGLLITSRQRELPDCEDFPVERLPLSASCALLEREAKANGLDATEAAALERVARMLGGLPLTLRMAGALVREHEARFSVLAEVLAKDGVLDTLDAESCRLEDYRANVDRALRGLIDECLLAVPAQHAEWLDILKTMAILPENAVVRGEFLRHFCVDGAKPTALHNPYRQAVRELIKRNLIELADEAETSLCLHPLIHEHFTKQHSQAFVDRALARATKSLLAPKHLQKLSAEAANSDGNAIILGRELEAVPSTAIQLHALRTAIMRQAHHVMDGWNVLPQLHLQAHLDGETELAERVDGAMNCARLRLRWSTSSTDPAQLRFLKGHESEVISCAFSPEGDLMLSGSHDGTLILWDREAGEPIKTRKGHESGVMSCAFSPNGERVLSASYDHTLTLWDFNAGEPIKTLKGHQSEVMSCTFSSDGDLALSGSHDGSLIFWDLEAGGPIRTWRHHRSAVMSCVFSRDSKRALSASHDGSLILWDLEAGEAIKVLEGHEDRVTSCAFRPNSELALSGSYDRNLMLWNLETGEAIKVLEGHEDRVWSCAFSPDGERALSTSYDGTLILWDLEAGETIKTLKGHEFGVTSCAFSRDGDLVLSGSHDGSLILWDLEAGETIKPPKGHKDRVWSCAFSPDGERALSASYDGSLILWDVEAGEPIKTLKGHRDGVTSCAFSRDGNLILSASYDHTLVLWDLKTGDPITTLDAHEGRVTSCAFSPIGERALSTSYDGTLILWDVEAGEPIKTLKGHRDGVTSCAFSRDGDLVLSGSHDGSLILWDLDAGEAIKSLKGHEDTVWSCAFSPNGERALSASYDGSLIFWDLEAGELIKTLKDHQDRVASCAFSPDGRRALSASHDRTLILWDLEAGEPIMKLALHGLTTATLSNDGRIILIGDGQGNVSLLEIIEP